MAKSYSFVAWLGAAPTEGKYTFEQGSALLAAEPYREQAIQKLQTVHVAGVGVRVMSRQEATDLVDNIILGVYAAAQHGAQTQIPIITRKVKGAIVGIEIGMLALGLAATMLVSKARHK